jgi:hypothetical protein
VGVIVLVSPSPGPSRQGRGIRLDAIHPRQKVVAFWHIFVKMMASYSGLRLYLWARLVPIVYVLQLQHII